MTVSMRVMSAGDGYKYLLRTVAAGDGSPVAVDAADPLLQRAKARRRADGWVPACLGWRSSIREGDTVTEAQLQLLIGMGRHPVTGEPLGRAYPAVCDRSRSKVSEPAAASPCGRRLTTSPSRSRSRRACCGVLQTHARRRSSCNAHHRAVAHVVALHGARGCSDAHRCNGRRRRGCTGERQRDSSQRRSITSTVARAILTCTLTSSSATRCRPRSTASGARSTGDRCTRRSSRSPSCTKRSSPTSSRARSACDGKPRDRGRDRNTTWAISGCPRGARRRLLDARHAIDDGDRPADRRVRHGTRSSPEPADDHEAARAGHARHAPGEAAALARRPHRWMARNAQRAAWTAMRQRGRGGRYAAAIASSCMRADDIPLDAIAALGET